MPGLLKQFGNGPPVTGAVGSPCTAGVWSKRRDEITFDQLQKLWSRLPLEARHMLLRIDKQTLFEQARKNLYCSRCNGLLLEGFSQIIIYGKSFQHEGSIMDSPNVVGPFKSEYNCESIDLNDPLAHPWGGLATTRDGTLTLLDCFINAKSLKALQNIFDNARARERERELLYPDACGGNGRGWISQGIASYGRVHGIRESCALHTARLSCDTLVGFWSALSNDTRSSLLRMKEEDFIERLMYRFDNKRFCRDCRRNVIREFKELKELKRMRRETRCSSWFCVADTAFQYEVLEDTVHADWRQSFADTVGTHHFEWAIGTEEGKSDILSFEDVGMNGKVQVNGLDLVGLSECFITLRACKFDGRCTELCVKAHALKGQPCVHRRLIIGDGFVTITKGESIEGFFEHAEEAEEEEEEEEDDDAMDKDGNEFDSDGALPQKHAKSPELAREFLLDAATVIFKEQVEKAFREATARQNAHSIFVSLALKLLEERIHVACKEIITLEKQNKLLEEEEMEKREEEERKERRRIKEREKKLRKKERLKEKERDREGPISLQFPLPTSNNNTSSTHDDSPNSPDLGDSPSDPGDISMLASPTSPDGTVEQLNVCLDANNLDSNSLWHEYHVVGDINSQDSSRNFELEQSESTRRKLRFKEVEILEQASKRYDKCYSMINDASSAQYDGAHRPSRERLGRASHRDCSLKLNDKFHYSNSRTRDRYDFHSCSCNQQGDHRANDGYSNSTIRSGSKNNTSSHKTEPSMDIARPLFRSSKYNHGGKLAAGFFSRDVHTKQVWEPLDSRKKHTGSNNDLDFTKKGSVNPHLSQDSGFDKDEDGCELHRTTRVASGDHHHLTKFSSDSFEPNALTNHQDTIEDLKQNMSNAAELEADSPPITGCEHLPSSSSSDNCPSCLSSEMDSSSSSLPSTKKAGSSSTSSDSEDTHAMHASACNGNPCDTFKDEASGAKTEACCTRTPTVFPDEGPTCIPLLYNQSMCVPVFLSPGMRYHDQAAASWAAAAPATGLLPFPQPSHFFPPTAFGYTLPHMQYSTLQHLAPPVLSVGHHPLFDSSKERVKNPNASAAAPQIKGAPNPPTGSMRHPERPPPNRHLPSKLSSAQENGSVGIAAKQKKDAPFFSLFHFGGPLLEPTRNVVNLVSLKEENTGDRSVSSLPASISCSKEETTVEEYSLFAASNSARFSFF